MSIVDQMLTPAQVARELKKGPRAIYKMITEGEIVAEDHRSPGATQPKYRIPRSEINRWRLRRRTRGNLSQSQSGPPRVPGSVTEFVV